MPIKDLESLKGLKEDDLQKLGPCIICNQQLINSTNLTFYKIEVSRGILNIDAIRRRVGAGMLMTNAIARILGPNEDLAKVFDGPHQLVIHEECALKTHHPLDLIQLKEEQEGTK